MSTSPSVLFSSGVSLVMSSTSRMGLSMMSPKLLRTAESFLDHGRRVTRSRQQKPNTHAYPSLRPRPKYLLPTSPIHAAAPSAWIASTTCSSVHATKLSSDARHAR